MRDKPCLRQCLRTRRRSSAGFPNKEFLNPLRTAVPFRDKPLKIQVSFPNCPQNETAVFKGLSGRRLLHINTKRQVTGAVWPFVDFVLGNKGLPYATATPTQRVGISSSFPCNNPSLHTYEAFIFLFLFLENFQYSVFFCFYFYQIVECYRT